MDEVTVGDVALRRSRWTEEWPQAWPDGRRRAEMIDRHAWIHAATALARGTAGRGRSVPSWPASSSPLAEQVVRDELGEAGVGPVAPVTAEGDAPPLRVERSRPGWHLSGVARGVPWSPVPRSLLVLGVDEGDNAVLALVDVDAPGVQLRHRLGAAEVSFDDVAVPARRVVHSADAGAALRERLTVLDLLGALDGLEEGATTEVDRDDVALCRAAVGVAVLTTASGRPLARQHDVSAAAVVVLLTGARLGLAADAGRLAWHRERLAPLL